MTPRTMIAGKPLGLTTLRVLQAIEVFGKEHGYSPASRDLLMPTGLKSVSTVWHHLNALRRQGYITYQDGIPRSIVVLRGSRSQRTAGKP